MVVEFSKILWRILLELLLMCSMGYLRLLIYAIACSFSSFHIHEWFLSKLVGTYARNFFISIMVKMPVVASLPFSYDSRI